MKILFIAGSLGYRGIPRALAGYAQMLSQWHEVRVWSYDDTDILFGGEVGQCLADWGFDVWVGHECLDKALAYNPDVVNLHRPGIPRKRDYDLLKEFHQAGSKCIETNVFGRVDWTIVPFLDFSIQISRWDLWQWTRWKGSKYPIRGGLCYNPVDCDRMVPAGGDKILEFRKKHKIPTDVKLLGRIGNSDWRILERPLLESLERLPSLHFIHVEDHCNNIPQTIVDHPRVHLCPRLSGYEELSIFYSSCDVMVSMSSIGESFGYVNAEAMACGTPVLALSTPLHCNAQSEIISPGLGGYTIAKPALLPVALEKFFGGNEATRLASNARELIVSRYSFTKVAPVLKAIFETVYTGRNNLGAFVERIEDAEIESLLKKTIGKHSLLVGIVFKLYYTSLSYAFLNCVKQKLSWLFALLKRGL